MVDLLRVLEEGTASEDIIEAAIASEATDRAPEAPPASEKVPIELPEVAAPDPSVSPPPAAVTEKRRSKR